MGEGPVPSQQLMLVNPPDHCAVDKSHLNQDCSGIKSVKQRREEEEEEAAAAESR